jgi:hypothetical protein
MKDAVVPRLDFNISNGSDDAGRRGRLGADEVGAGLFARIPRGVIGEAASWRGIDDPLGTFTAGNGPVGLSAK